MVLESYKFGTPLEYLEFEDTVRVAGRGAGVLMSDLEPGNCFLVNQCSLTHLWRDGQAGGELDDVTHASTALSSSSSLSTSWGQLK